MAKYGIFLFILLPVLISGCAQNVQKVNVQGAVKSNMEKVSFLTSDNVLILGNYWGSDSDKAILLLHMMPATKESWNSIAPDLNEKGYKVLAIDLRGHGESNKKGYEILDYRKFSNEEHAKSIEDVKAAIEFLKQRGAKEFGIIGASIGANLALVYGADEKEVKIAVLLSPGLDYRGIKTELPAEKFDRPLLIIASEEDSYSAQSSRILDQKAKNSELKILQNRGHGTNMFSEPGLKEEILEWVAENF